MNIKIQSRDLTISEARKQQISNLIYMELSRFGFKVKRTEMVLSEVAMPGNVSGFKCLMRMRINHLKTIAVHESSPTLEDAIAVCILRAKRTLGRQLDRHRQVTHQVKAV